MKIKHGLPWFTLQQVVCINLAVTHCLCVVGYFDVFQNSCSRSRGSKCQVLQGIRPHKSCSEASQVVHIFHSKLCLFVIFHTSIHTFMHACTFIDSLIYFFKDMYIYIYIQNLYTYMCVCVVCYQNSHSSSRGSKCQVPQGIRPHKPCSEASQVVHIFQSKLCLHPYIHTYMHVYTHTLLLIVGFFERHSFDIQYSGVYL